jgi:hypothetical protein
MGKACGTYGGRRGVHRVLVRETSGGRGHLEYLDVDIRTIVKLIFKKYDVAAWSGLIWLTSRTNERLF